MHRNVRIAAAFALVALAACSPPKPPEEERRPEPQAREAHAKPAIARTADTYKDAARNAASATQDAAAKEKAALDAATQ